MVAPVPPLAMGRVPVTSEVRSMSVPKVAANVMVSVPATPEIEIPDPLEKVSVSVAESATGFVPAGTATVSKLFISYVQL